jgi:SAM-dependent methyltransferase
MPPAGTTAQVARVMPPSISAPVLDVGCGPGSLALVAAQRGAPAVVGTDVNPRALDLACFNARLNGLAKVEFLVGDLVEPVRGRRFELIVAQPPFVIQPPGATAVTFLHGGPRGEELAVRLMAGVPDVLAAGGRALVLMEAVARPDEPLHARLRPALGEADVDLLVLAAAGPPPAFQVIAYASLEAPGGGQAYAAAARRYLEHVDSLGTGGFQHALVIVRHRAGHAGQGRIDATLPVGSISRGDHAALEGMLESIDLAALDDARLAQRAVRASTRALWFEERPLPHAELEAARSVRFRTGSFGNDFLVDERRYHLWGRLDRAPTIQSAVEAYASEVGVEQQQAVKDVLGSVREGLMRGVLEPG